MNNKYRDYHTIFVDIETSRLDVSQAEIIDISVLRDNEFGLTIASCNSKIRPNHIVDCKAAEINGYNEEKWKFAPTECLVFLEIGRKIFDPYYNKKHIVIGYFSSIFDRPIIDNRYKFCNLVSPFDKWIDLADIAWPLVLSGQLESRSLDCLSKHYGVQNKAPHTALGDTEVTREIYYKLTQQLLASLMLTDLVKEGSSIVKNFGQQLLNRWTNGSKEKTKKD